MAKWKAKVQECKGNYFFSGAFYVTRGVYEELPPDEIAAIYLYVQHFVKDHNGADYLFVFTDDQQRKLFLIDQLNIEMIQSGNFAQEHNYCTLLWAHEY